MKKIGLNSNMLKLIAIITMVIDHIGYYFYYSLNSEVYITLRIIGRISMPIFVFCLIQGYFHTKNLKNYLLRLSVLAVVTQICLNVLGFINKTYLIDYEVSIYKSLNIVFSFSLSIILIYIIDKIMVLNFINIKNKIKFEKNSYIYILLFILILFIYYIIPIDYGYVVPIISLIFYISQKLKYVLTTSKQKVFNKYFDILSYFGIFLVGVFNGYISIFMFLSLIFIVLYNDQKGKDSKYISKIFYLFFPLHHIILYGIAIYIYFLNNI